MAAEEARRVRRHRRRTVRVKVEMHTDEGAWPALATTLGAGGLFVATAEPLPPDARLVVVFRLPHESTADPPRRIAARVVWASPPGQPGAGRSPGMGLAFIDPAAVAALAHALDREGPQA